MSDELVAQAEQILAEALDLPRAEQDRHVASRCQHAPELEAIVRRLLEAHRAFEMPDDPLPSRIGDYDIEAELDRGGMGVVYLGRQRELNRRAAIKVVLSAMDTRALRARFRIEQRALGGVEHPNIARLYEVGATDDGKPYFAMEYVDGLRIDRHCDKARLSIHDRLRLFERVCAAVHVVHQNAVIHRDISARNVLVGSGGTPKLLDFGLAKLLSDAEESLTVSGRHWLTPAYASPEQTAGAAITTSTDIYSLGVLLYVLLTGCLPSTKGHITDRSSRGLRAAEIVPPSVIVVDATAHGQDAAADSIARADARGLTPDQLSQRLRGDLDNIVMRALADEPRERYASADQFGADIARHLVGQPVLARPATWRYVAAKFVSRHRAAVAATLLVAVLLAAALVAVVYQSVVAREAQARAERRFNDVRRLANAFIFEFDDAIANLEGATPARQLVVTRAREYLDSLVAEAETSGLVQELATAYERVGDLQGNPYSQSLGLIDDAIGSYRTARALRQRLYDAGGREAALVRALATSHLKIGDVLWVKREFAAARTEYEAARTLDRAVLVTNPSDASALADLSVVFTALGDTQAELSDLEGALDAHRQSLEIRSQLAGVADDANLQRNVAVGEVKIADVLSRRGDRQAAAAAYRRATAILQRLVEADETNALFGSNLIAAVQRLSLLLADDGKAHEAVEEMQRALPLARRLAGNDLTNAVAQRDLAASLSCLGEVLQKDGRTAEAMSYLSEYLRKQEELARVPGNGQAERDLWIAHLQLGRAAVAADSMTEGERHARESLEMALRLWPNPSEPSQMDDLADAYALSARVARRLRREEDAQRHFDRAVSLRKALTSRFPDDQDYKTRLSEVVSEWNAKTPAGQARSK